MNYFLGFIRVTSTGEDASSPHCSWSDSCQYDDASKGKCANALCQAKGYLSGSFVNSSNNFCNVSFTSDSVFLYMVDTNITEQGSYNAEASITADCDAGLINNNNIIIIIIIKISPEKRVCLNRLIF